MRNQVKCGQVKSEWQVRNGQVRTGQVRTGQVRTGQVRTDQVRTGEVRIYQFSTGHVMHLRLEFDSSVGPTCY